MNSPEAINQNDGAGCEACPLVTDRREFLRSAAAFALGALAMGLPIRSATAKVVAKAASGHKMLSYQLPAADGAEIDRDNDVILVRFHDEVCAFNLSCPHQNTALRWNEDVGRFQCPKHHSQYQPTGEFITGRATRNMDRLAIRRDASNNIIVDPDTLYQSDDDPAAWNAAIIKV